MAVCARMRDAASRSRPLFARARRLRAYPLPSVGLVTAIERGRLVEVGRDLITIGGKLILLGGGLVSIGGRLIEIGSGLIAVRDRLVELGERLVVLPLGCGIVLDRFVGHRRPLLGTVTPIQRRAPDPSPPRRPAS